MGIKILAKNKRASFDFHLEKKFEAGMVLRGTEVKSLRKGKVSLNESHITIDNFGEVWAHNISIPVYEFGNIHNHEETRKRKLLLSRKQIAEIAHEMSIKRLTLVPTAIYFKDSLVKLEFALAKGKKLHDKREDTAKKEVERKLKRGLFQD